MSAGELRPVHHTDVPELARLEAEIYGPDAWSPGSWWGELAARPRRAYVVAQREGAVCGYAGLDLGTDVADVMTVTVAPAARRGGWGTRLMRWLVDTAEASGAGALMLEVRSDNEPALALYRRWGFEQLARRRDYYQGADALIWRRLLGPRAESDPDGRARTATESRHTSSGESS